MHKLYLVVVLLTMLVFPMLSIIVELYWTDRQLGVDLIGKWFLFWGLGLRQLIGGFSQIINPGFTAHNILGEDIVPIIFVLELGFANISMGIISICSLWISTWRLPAAVVGGLFMGLCGIYHITRGIYTINELIATVNDLFMLLAASAFAALKIFGL